mgnify:FL=1
MSKRGEKNVLCTPFAGACNDLCENMKELDEKFWSNSFFNINGTLLKVGDHTPEERVEIERLQNKIKGNKCSDEQREMIKNRVFDYDINGVKVKLIQF